jgi:hypothetical protein
MRDVNGRFKMGNKGGPGRPPGSRNSLGDDFVAAIHVDWREHGAAVLQEVRSSSPAAYLRVVASLVPRQISVDRRDDFAGVSDQELMAQLADCLADLATQLNVPKLAQAIKITMREYSHTNEEKDSEYE